MTFAIRDCRDALAATGTKIDRLLAVGGGSRSDYWLRAIATRLNTLSTCPPRATSAGLRRRRLAMMAATGQGARICTLPPIARTIDPDPALTAPSTPPCPLAHRPRSDQDLAMTDFFAGIPA